MADARIAILMVDWGTPSPTAGTLPRWSKATLEKVFEERNGYSVGSYWDTCAHDLVRTTFEVHDLGTLAAAQGTLDDRGALLDRVKALAATRGVSLDGYDSVCAFMHPNPNNAGVSGRDLVLDRDAIHAFYAHQVGLVLGLQPPFGPGQPPGKAGHADSYCIMGWLSRFAPIDRAGIPDAVQADIGTRLWEGGPMASPATLHRWLPAFGASGKVRELSPGFDGNVDLASVGQPQAGMPILIRLVVSPSAAYYVEYRTPTGWDGGVDLPTVVIHSIGLPDRVDPQGQTNGNGAVWFERVIYWPFTDEWTEAGGRWSVEVDHYPADKSRVTLRVRSPAGAKRAHIRLATRVASSSIERTFAVWRSRADDPLLCNDDAQAFEMTIRDFAETVELRGVTEQFAQPRVTGWFFGEKLAVNAETSGNYTLPGMSVRQLDVQARPPFLPGLVERTSIMPVDISTAATGDRLTIGSRSPGASFSCEVMVVIRDDALSLDDPYCERHATITVSFDASIVEWGDDYRRAADACWERRRYRPEPRPPGIYRDLPRPPWFQRVAPRPSVRLDELERPDVPDVTRRER